MVHQKVIKTLAVGFHGAGKSSMLITYTRKKFPDPSLPIIFDAEAIDVGGNAVLALWDAAGGEDYDKLRPLSYPDTNVFILCFDVTRKDLFADIESYWYSELRHYCPDVPIILTATKIDLREAEENCVTTEEGEALAARTGSQYTEISSLEGIGVEELFTKVIELGMEHEAKERKKRHKKCCVL